MHDKFNIGNKQSTKSCINQEKACFNNSKNACKNLAPRLPGFSATALQPWQYNCGCWTPLISHEHKTKPRNNNIEQHIKINQSNIVNKSQRLISTLNNNRGKFSKCKSTYTHPKLTCMSWSWTKNNIKRENLGGKRTIRRMTMDEKEGLGFSYNVKRKETYVTFPLKSPKITLQILVYSQILPYKFEILKFHRQTTPCVHP